MIKALCPCRLVVLISGSGTNLQAIIDACHNDALPAQVVAVISNQSQAYGLNRARAAGIPAQVLDHRDFAGRAAFDAKLQNLVDTFVPDLVVLAGFMRILGESFATHYTGRMLNIHPSLLPDYPGLDTHARALADGKDQHGATVHFVTPELDAGPIIIQGRVPVLANDTAETLAQRVHEVEYRIYPQAIDWFAQGRLVLQHGQARLDGRPITP